MGMRTKDRRSVRRSGSSRSAGIAAVAAKRSAPPAHRPSPVATRTAARGTATSLTSKPTRKIAPFAAPERSNGHSNAHGAKTAAPVTGGINSYAKALRFLASLSDYERLRIVRYTPQNFDLDRMRNLLKRLGNPQDQFRSVHIAGTKGKGSTAAMTASMLEASGYKVGLYTSPHLVDIRERIVIDGEMISQAEFARLTKLIEPIIA
jgi:UDP-N-acetylmuramyl pentapeptide synthase